MIINLIFKSTRKFEREDNKNRKLDIEKHKDKKHLNKKSYNSNKNFNYQNLLICKEK
jgi:hypothetical protein